MAVEDEIQKPSNKLLAVIELNSNTSASEVRRICRKKQPLASAGLHALRDDYTRSIGPACALAAGIIKGPCGWDIPKALPHGRIALATLLADPAASFTGAALSTYGAQKQLPINVKREIHCQ